MIVGEAWIAAQTEASFQSAIEDCAAVNRWFAMHVGDSNRDDPGRPDLTLGSRRWFRLVVMEVKKEGGETSAAQRVWLDLHADAGIETYLVYPRHWDEIVTILTSPDTPDPATLDCAWKPRADDEHEADVIRMLRDAERNRARRRAIGEGQKRNLARRLERAGL